MRMVRRSKQSSREGGLFFGSCRFGSEPRSNHWLQEGHHGPQARTELLDGMLLFSFALGKEVRAASFVFGNPFLCEAAVANFCEKLLHFVASLLCDDARAGGVIAMLGGVTDGITHVAEAAAIDEINDQLQFVEAFEIGDFRLIAGVRECFETCFNELTHAAAKNCLLPKKVCFCFFGEGRFKNARARATDGACVGKS